MSYVILSLTLIVVAAIGVSALVLAVRVIVAIFKRNHNEVERLTTPYEIAEYKAITHFKRFGVTKEEFAALYEECLRRNPNALPWDAYRVLVNTYLK